MSILNRLRNWRRTSTEEYERTLRELRENREALETSRKRMTRLLKRLDEAQAAKWGPLKTSAAIVGLGLGASALVSAVEKAHQEYKVHAAYERLIKRYPKFKTPKYAETFYALADMAPEVAQHPIMAAPLLERAHAYGSDTGVPSVLLDVHSKVRPRRGQEPSSWASTLKASVGGR